MNTSGQKQINAITTHMATSGDVTSEQAVRCITWLFNQTNNLERSVKVHIPVEQEILLRQVRKSVHDIHSENGKTHYNEFTENQKVEVDIRPTESNVVGVFLQKSIGYIQKECKDSAETVEFDIEAINATEIPEQTKINPSKPAPT